MCTEISNINTAKAPLIRNSKNSHLKSYNTNSELSRHTQPLNNVIYHTLNIQLAFLQAMTLALLLIQLLSIIAPSVQPTGFYFSKKITANCAEVFDAHLLINSAKSKPTY